MKYSGFIKTKDGIEYLKKVQESYIHSEKSGLLHEFNKACNDQKISLSEMLTGILDDKKNYPMFSLEDSGWPTYHMLTDCYYIAEFYSRATHGISK